MKRQMEMEEIEMKKQDDKIEQLLLEEDTFKKQTNQDREIQPPAARPKERRERIKPEVDVKQKHGNDGFDIYEREPVHKSKDFEMSSQISETSQISQIELEWLKDRLSSLEKLVQEREESEKQYDSRPLQANELERKERYLKNLERDLNKKEEEIRANLNLNKPPEGMKQTDTGLKKRRARTCR